MIDFIKRIRLKSVLPVPMGSFSWFMAMLQLYYLYEVFVTNDTGGVAFSLAAIGATLWSMITIVVLFQCLANTSQK